ncbi:pyroglutamyl-peptidase I [Corynebacterium phoceense]|uniref:pyroglutamyl-peptidase I n=1 Tax=Corynebacterium phoceense TaxID=1686286 RepID=UPI00211B9B73|nr:pyroglutamyl-peptidase I [Corynebacterium phoceense]MCQ9333248.1 pyroglutamyl-peptidase I [Corynebacterium phoceense]
MRIVVTAFDPFGGQRVNPAQLAVAELPSRIAGADIVRFIVLTRFGTPLPDLTLADAVLCVGQAGGRAQLTPERVAINIDDASIPDNAGNQPTGTPIVENGPAAYFATLPVKAMVAAIRDAGLPAALSNTAGTFVCNHLMYRTLHATAGTATRAGFIHVPYAPEQGEPSLPVADITRGLVAAIEAIVAHPDGDLVSAEGATH